LDVEGAASGSSFLVSDRGHTQIIRFGVFLACLIG
jgi:hypothetical protein